MSRRIWVVSWVYWNGDEQGGGGFWWYPDHRDAVLAFEEEKRNWASAAVRVRLVSMILPNEAHSCSRATHTHGDVEDVITCWIDSNIDLIEAMQSQGGLPAERVWINAGVPA